MKPNFALSLSFEGIRLLHRSGTGWTVVGDVALESPDLGGELAMLRKTALALDPAGLRTKILLPKDQIKYIAIDGTRATEDDIRTALDGATPYAVSDLVYDYVRGGGRTYIAAVARETLEEAEAFAADHRFGPVAFVGVPEEFTFVGESFFGMTKAAATLLQPGETVERDSQPVKVAVKAARPPLPPTEPIKAAPPPTDSPVTASPDAQVAARPVEQAIPEPEQVEPVKEALPEPVETKVEPVVESQSKPQAEVPETLDETPVPASAADAPASQPQPDDKPEIAESKVTAGSPKAEEAAHTATAEQAISVSEDAAALPAAIPEPHVDDTATPPPAVDEATPVFASRARPPRALVADPTGRTTPTPPPPVAKSAPPVTVSERAEPVFSRRPPAPPPSVPVRPATTPSALAAATPGNAPVAAGPALPPAGRLTIDSVGLGAKPVIAALPAPTLSAPAITGVSVAAKSESSIAAGASPLRPVTAPPSQRPTVVPFAPPRTTPPDPVAAPVAPDRVTPIGTRRKPAEAKPAAKAAPAKRQRGKPRFLGLILTIILLIAMAAVAMWATGADTAVSRWLGGEADPVEVAAAVPVADPVTISTTETPEPTLDSVPEIAETDQELVPSEEALIAATPSDTALPDAVAAAAAAAFVANAIDGLANPETTETAAIAPPEEVPATPSLDPAVEVAADATEGTVLSADDADRFYAATGVWLRAPRLPLIPESEVIDGLVTAAPDTSPAAPETISLAPSSPDPGLVTQPNPPPPGTQFARDARGFILATPEGTLTPGGTLIFAGQPAVIPPTRPGTVAPDAPAPVADLAATADAGLTTIIPGQPMTTVPETRPLARTETFIANLPPEALAASETVDAADVNAAADAIAALAEEPPLSPTAEPETPATAGAVTLAGLRPQPRPGTVEAAAAETVALASFEGPRPTLRPEGLAPEGATSLAEEEAAAVEEETPADPSAVLNETLAAIVENASDPLAGASALAIAVAPRPDSRPANFSRVVQQQTARLARAQPAASAPASTAAQPEEAETASEDVPVAAAAPSGPVPGSVAEAATIDNAMSLREINLIGVYGRPNDRRALVRLDNGRYVRVGIGDSLDGGQVAAITDSTLNYTRRGRTITLEIPDG